LLYEFQDDEKRLSRQEVASGEPLIMNGLPAGPHKVLIELVNPNHQTLDKGIVTFVIPKGIEPHSPH
jgi:hypothetical protein